MGTYYHELFKKDLYPEAVVRRIARQLIQGVLHMHKDLSLCHNDLHPANILFAVDKRRIKFADFGAATTFTKNGPLFNPACRPPYRSPEREVSPAADMWSIGVILFFCLFGRKPCLEQGYNELLDILHKRPAQKTNKIALSRHAKQFLCSLIHMDPDVRMTAEEALAHPWLAGPMEKNSAPPQDCGIERVSSHDSESSTVENQRKRRPVKRIATSLGRFVSLLKRSDEPNSVHLAKTDDGHEDPTGSTSESSH